MIYGIAGVVLALVLGLIWLNISWVRRQDSKGTDKRGNEVDDGMGSTSVSTRSQTRTGPYASADKVEANRYSDKATGVDIESANDMHGNGEEKSKSTTNLEAGVGDDSDSALIHPGEVAGSVEVLERQTNSTSSVFNRAPYQLNATKVPEFAADAWKRSFHFLTNEDSVLGWIAFAGDTVGACDQKYDDEFLVALRDYRHSARVLQRQVGLSQVHETSIVGDEGRVWFLTVIDDAWFALFVDKSANRRELTRRLLSVHEES